MSGWRTAEAAQLDAARIVLKFRGDTNYGQATHFELLLAQAIYAANESERDTLRQVYQELVHAVEVAKGSSWGIETLRSIVKADLDRRERGLDFSAVQS